MKIVMSGVPKLCNMGKITKIMVNATVTVIKIETLVKVV